MICPLCKGSQWLVSYAGGIQHWPCPACGASGVSIQYGPATIKAHRLRAAKTKD